MGPERRKVSVRAIVVLAAVAGFVLLVDQAAKFAVTATMTPGQTVQLVGDQVTIHYVKNAGAAFSIGTGSTWIFTIIALGVLGFVVWWAPRIRSVAWAIVLGLLLGGLLGNLGDRLFRPPSFGQGQVIDFITIPLLPAVFNLADSAITLAAVLFVVLTIRGIGLDGRRHVTPSADPADPDRTPTDPGR